MGEDGRCPGSCNSGYRKAWTIYDAALADYTAALDRTASGQAVPDPPETPTITPWLGEPVWCTRCQSVIRRELYELDDLAALVAATPPGIRPAITGQRQHVKVSGTRGTASPSPGGDLLEELAHWLRNWESAYRKEDPQARRGYLASEITTGIAWLGHHFDSIIIHPDLACDFGSETRTMHRELTAASHAGSAAKHVKKPCPRCKNYTLWENIGDDYITCVNDDCNRRLTRADLEAETEAGAA